MPALRERCVEKIGKAHGDSLAEMVELVTADGSASVPRASVLGLAAYHSGHHYGSVATYFRLNGMVPPSTERSQAESQTGENE